MLCQTCHHETNSYVSNYAFNNNKDIATKCYARFIDGKWEKGCAYNEADDRKRKFVDKLILNEPDISPEKQ